MTNLPPPPSPGIYENVPDAEYRSWPCVSSSFLKKTRNKQGDLCLDTFNEKVDVDAGPGCGADTLAFGTLVHAAILEPHRLPHELAIMPEFHLDDENVTASGKPPKNPRGTKYYRSKVREFRAENEGKIILPQDMVDGARTCVQSIRKDQCASAMLSEPGRSELSIVWDEVLDDDWLIPCKARLDRQCSRLIDIKTSRNVEDFDWQMRQLQYDAQAGFYCRGYRSLTGVDKEFAFIVAGNCEPFDVSVRILSSTELMEGEARHMGALRAFGQWLIAGEIPLDKVPARRQQNEKETE